MENLYRTLLIITISVLSAQSQTIVHSLDSILHCENDVIQYDYSFYGTYELENEKPIFIRYKAKKVKNNIEYEYLEKSNKYDKLKSIYKYTDIDTLKFRLFQNSISKYKGEIITPTRGQCESQLGSRYIGWGDEKGECGGIEPFDCTDQKSEIFVIENGLWSWLKSKFNDERWNERTRAGDIVPVDRSFFAKLKRANKPNKY